MGTEVFKPARWCEEHILRQPDHACSTFGKVHDLAKHLVWVTLASLIALSPQHSVLVAQDNVAAQEDIFGRPSGVVKNSFVPDTAAAPDAGVSSARTSNKNTTDGTRVSVPIDLEPLHRRGGVPKSLEILRMMEKQQRMVAERASNCTVSVKIGPAQGCGVIITATGHIFTAAHVAMRPGLKAIVTLPNGRQVRATTLGMNKNVDAGLIRIDADQNGGAPWHHASLGTSDDLVPGMWCIAMGHPGGYDSGRGAVIRVGRLLEVRSDVIVTDCALIGGDSGGPLFNMAGELIAVHSRIGNDVADNLHVPIDHYDYSWERMSAGESWGFLPGFKPTLGVSGSQSTSDARVAEVKKGSPAEAAGLLSGDIVVRFGRKSIADFQSLKKAVDDTMPGERVSIAIKRGTTRLDLVVEIGRSD